MSEAIELHVQTVDAAGSTAPWVLCVHSSGLMGKQWLQLMRLLRERYRLAVPDLIGYGSTASWPGPIDDFGVGHELAALQRLVAELDGPVHLVGHSYGGFLVLELARRTSVATIDLDVASVAAFEPTVWGVLWDDPGVVSDGPPPDDPAFEREVRQAREAFQSVLAGPIFARSEADRGVIGDDTWMRGFVDFWNGDGAWDALTPPRRRLMLETGPKTAREVLELCWDRTSAAEWATIRAPTLLMVGRDSNALERTAVTRLTHALPNASLRTVEGGHMAPIQNASEVNDAIVAHIERHTH